jgi:O-antigen/teichoic acid export membrane protein
VSGGDLVYAACGWLILILLVKLGTAELVGVYALGVAVSMPVSVLVGLGLTGGLITDVSRGCNYGRYISLRLVTAAVSILLVSAITVYADYSPADRLVVILVAVSTAIASVREIFLAAMKRNECMSLVGISQTTAGLGMLITFSVTFWLTRSLAWAVVAIGATRAAVAMFYDLPHVRGLARAFDDADVMLDWTFRPLVALGWLTAPLAVAMALATLVQNIPKYFLEAFHGVEALGYLAAMVAVVAAGSRLMNALGTAVTPRLSRYFVENRAAYVWLTVRVCAIALLGGSVVMLIVYALGRPILTLLFTPEYAGFSREFLLLMVNLTLMLLVSCMNQALVASRAFRQTSMANLAVCAVSLVFAWWLIRPHGLWGACYALIATSAFWLVMLTALYVVRVRSADRRPSSAGRTLSVPGRGGAAHGQ